MNPKNCRSTCSNFLLRATVICRHLEVLTRHLPLPSDIGLYHLCCSLCHQTSPNVALTSFLPIWCSPHGPYGLVFVFPHLLLATLAVSIAGRCWMIPSHCPRLCVCERGGTRFSSVFSHEPLLMDRSVANTVRALSRSPWITLTISMLQCFLPLLHKTIFCFVLFPIIPWKTAPVLLGLSCRQARSQKFGSSGAALTQWLSNDEYKTPALQPQISNLYSRFPLREKANLDLPFPLS